MKAVHQAFEHQVERAPQQVAVTQGLKSVSYRELNAHANRLSRVLVQLGVEKDVFVGVLLPVGAAYVSALLATFKAGGVYLPLDWNFAAKRFGQIFSTSFSGYLIVAKDQVDRALKMAEDFQADLRYLIVINDDAIEVYNTAKRTTVPVSAEADDNLNLSVDAEANTYIYYTSGSTGEGKAIVGNHKALSHYIHWEIREFALDATCRVSQIAQITFDASLKDIFTALCSGGTLCIPTQEEKTNLPRLAQWIAEKQITLLQCVPSIFRLITQELLLRSVREDTTYPSLRQVILAGEMLFAKDIQQWRLAVGNHVALANLYGATESTILKTCYRIGEVPTNPSQIIPVGKPMDDTSVAIINDNHICRPGEKGELYIRTPYLTNGYYRNDALNDAAFVQNPLTTKHDRVYKTGDIGRYLKSGDIEVLGRIDDQIKLNGVRVELGEIVGAMLSIPGIDKAVVIPHSRSQEQTELVAYYTNPAITPDQVREALRTTLNPEFFPSYFIALESFPLNINGKVNKKLLPTPESFLNTVSVEDQPKGQTELKLATVWKSVLKLRDVDRKASFFHLGGNSIKALQITSQVYQQFGINLKLATVFESPSIEQLASVIDQSMQEGYRAIPVIEEQEHYALSFGQRRIWALLQLENDGGAYNMHAAYTLDNGFAIETFTKAFGLLLKKHESLRTCFVDIEGEPRQRFRDIQDTQPDVPVYDLRGDARPDEQVKTIAIKNARTQFDLNNGPLYRVEVARLTDQQSVLFFTIHHSIADGWSTEILSRELADLYDRIDRGLPVVDINTHRIQYKDYVAWQADMLDEDTLSPHRKYWLTQFSGDVPVLNLPTIKGRPRVKTYSGNRIRFAMESTVSESVVHYCRNNGMSPYVFFMGTLNHLLYRYTGDTDLVIGSPAWGRDHADLENQIGFFLNNLAIRTRFDKDDTFQDLLTKTRTVVLDAQRYNDYPFHLLVTQLGLKRDLSRSPLYDVWFTWHEVASDEETRDVAFTLSRYETPFVTAKGDLWFHGMKTQQGIVFFVEYNTDLFQESWIQTLSEHFVNLVSGELAGTDEPISATPYLLPRERRQQIEQFSQEAHAVPAAARRFGALFRAAAQRAPESIAVEHNGQRITYAALDQASDRLAAYISQAWSLKPNDLVAVMTGRSVECIVGLLAILKSGAAFLPIDATLPAPRIASILDDAKVSGIMTESHLIFNLPEGTTTNLFALDVQLNDLADVPAVALATPDAAHMAYVIYTSGSSGRPKGVAIQHKSFDNYLNWANHYYFDNTTGHVFAWFTSLSFDLTLTSIFTTLMRGDKLVVCDALENDALLRYVFDKSNDINTVKLTPSHLGILSYITVAGTNIRTVIVGGEKLNPEQVDALWGVDPTIALYNEYGPTETTVGCTVHRVADRNDCDAIGRPIHGAAIYVLDESQNLLPEGCPGEICVGGIGVSRGYLNNRELTANKFIPNPFVEGDLLYRTGDKGRWSTDGILLYHGRLDSQVKIKGYRIELEEIAACLTVHDAIAEAAVLPRYDETGTHVTLLAFYRMAGDRSVDLKQYLKRYLPEYMIPSEYLQVERFPLTHNGKLDTARLLALVTAETGAPVAQPVNALQHKLKNIWEMVLGRQYISIHDNFFDIGGESLKAIQLVYHIGKAFQVKIKPSDVFLYPSISALSAVIAKSDRSTFVNLTATAVEEQEHYPVSHAQKRLWLFDRMNRGNKHAYHIPSVYRIEGDFQVEYFRQALELATTRHESLRTAFVAVNDVPRQKVIPVQELVLHCEVIDLSALPNKTEVFDDAKHTLETAPFDLECPPLFRVAVVKMADNEFRLLFTIHHIIADEWSFEVLGKEVMTYYEALYRGNTVDVAMPALQYKAYTLWQNAIIAGDEMSDHKTYWLEKFSSRPALIDLPFARLRPGMRTFSGRRTNFTISPELTAQLRDYSRKSDLSLFMVLFGALKILIYRYTRESDIVLNTPTVGRDHADLETLMGNFVNMLPMRSTINGNDRVEQFLDTLKMTMLEAYDHQAYPFDCLLEALNLEIDPSRQPLFDIGFTWHTPNIIRSDAEHPSEHTGAEAAVSQDATDFVMAKADMWWHAMDGGNQVGMSVVYNTDLFDERDMQRFSAHYQELLSDLLSHRASTINQLAYLTKQEVEQIDRLATNVQANEDMWGIAARIEQHAVSTPDAIALTIEDRNYSYRELNNKANQLARVLREKYQINRGDIVAVVVHRSEWIMFSFLAVVKTGAVYLPVDPDNPPERLSYILQNSGIKALITQSELLIDLMEFYYATLVLVDMELDVAVGEVPNPGVPVSASDPAYVIYTSGSTGEPKGVMTTQGGLMNLLQGLEHTLDYRICNHFALMASISFDSSFKQMLVPLMQGRHLVILDRIKDIRYITETIARQKIEAITITPTVLQVVVSEMSDRKIPNYLKVIACGGEVLPTVFCNALLDYFPAATIVNVYGPTETTDLAAVYPVTTRHTDWVPVGKPLPNCEVFVLDEALQRVPLGSKGEIYIGGKGVSLGYIGDAERTAQKFMPHPFVSGERIYKTGDLGFVGEDGYIRIVGRADNQIKIRGHRIELGEIQNQLSRHPHVRQCAATAVGEGADKEIVVYVVEKSMITLRPSWAEQYVYDDMAYYAMSNDQYRIEKYREALSRVVNDKVVLEIGPGAEAVLSLMALECGARKVYAVEILEESYRKAKKKIALMGLSNRIEILHGDITRIDLPEQVDCCIADIVGSIGGSQGAAKIMNESRRLMTAAAAVVPARSVSRIAAVTLPRDTFEYAFDEVGAHYVRKIFERVGYSYDLRLSLDKFPVHQCISTTGTFEDLDYRGINALDESHTIELQITAGGILNGFIVWLDMYFDDTTVVDTLNNREQKLWLPVYLPVFPEGMAVRVGDSIQAMVSRKLSKDELHPDYSVEGRVVRRDDQDVPFSYLSLNEERVIRHNAFYQEVFKPVGSSVVDTNAGRTEDVRVYKPLDHQSVVSYLSHILPHYMLPAHVVKVDSIPTTVSGKVDFRALPLPETHLTGIPDVEEIQLNSVELRLLNIWKDVLKRRTIAPHDSFFAIGGHSLRAAQLISRVHLEFAVEFDLKDVFDNPTIVDMAKKIAGMETVVKANILPVEEQDHYHVSHAQKRLWLKQQSDDNLIAFNNPITLELQGDFDFEAFQRAFEALVDKHEILRTVFITVGGEPRQRIHTRDSFRELVEYADLSNTGRQQDVESVTRLFVEKPFDLKQGPLVKCMLVKVSDDRYLWLFSTHHIISDAWSLGIMMDELLSHYTLHRHGATAIQYPKLPIQYKDFTVWQTGQIEADGAHRAFWLDQFREMPDPLELPVDFPRLKDAGFAGDHVVFPLSARLSSRIRQYAVTRDASLFVTLTTLVSSLLYRYTGQTQLILGTNVAGRDHQDLEGQIGFYLNTLPIAITVDESKSFAQLHDHVRQQVLNAFQHQIYPYDLLIAELGAVGHDTGRPLFNVEVELISVNMGNQQDVSLEGITISNHKNTFNVSKDDLSFRFVEDGDQITLNIGYRIDLFERATIVRMLKHMEQLADAMLTNEASLVAEVDYLSTEEKQQLAGAFNTLN